MHSISNQNVLYFKVGRILDTIFNNNHDSSSSSLLSTGTDDFVILDAPSHSAQSAIHTSTGTSTSSSSSSSSSNSEPSNYLSISEVRPTIEASTSSSPQKESSTQIENDASSVAENTSVPETCTNASDSTSNPNGCSGASSRNAESSGSSTRIDNSTKTVCTHNRLSLNEKLVHFFRLFFLQCHHSNCCLLCVFNDDVLKSVFFYLKLQKKLSLEEENRQLKDARLCKVCMDDDVAVVFLPCGHLGE